MTAMTLAGDFTGAAASSILLPANLIPSGMNGVVLHHGDTAALAFVRDIRLSFPLSQIDDRPVQVLARGGFTETARLLDRASGRAMVALLGDAEALVIEGLLRLRNARAMANQRYGRQALLTARL